MDNRDDVECLYIDIDRYKAYMYDQNMGKVKSLTYEIEDEFHRRGLDVDYLGIHLVSWKKDQFNIYLPTREWLDYEQDRNPDKKDLFLESLDRQYSKGFRCINDFADISHFDRCLKFPSNEEEYISYHIRPLKSMFRTYRIYGKNKER